VDLLAPLKAFDRLQRRRAPLAIPLAVVKKFSDDQAGGHAALIAYYGFFALFPLLLLFTSILGFVLQGHPHTEASIVDSTLSQIPLVGADIGGQGHLRGSGFALAVGLIGTILGGLGVTLAAQNAFNTIYAVPYRERPDFLRSRLRGLGVLVAIGTLQIVSTAASGLVAAGGLHGAGLVVAGLAVSLGLNLLLFVACFRLLTDRAITTRELRPGIATAAVLWTALQAVGGLYVNHVLKGARETYGTFATVIGLLTWLYLGGRVVVYAAELNTVLSRHLWPRGLFDPPTPADQRTLTALAKVEERSDRQSVDVEFHPDVTDP
jgi:YihY family inner membrane protein